MDEGGRDGAIAGERGEGGKSQRVGRESGVDWGKGGAGASKSRHGTFSHREGVKGQSSTHGSRRLFLTAVARVISNGGSATGQGGGDVPRSRALARGTLLVRRKSLRRLVDENTKRGRSAMEKKKSPRFSAIKKRERKSRLHLSHGH